MFRSLALLPLLALVPASAPFPAQDAVSSAAQAAAISASPFAGSAFSLPAAAIRTASGAITADKLSDVTILYEESSYRIAASGALTYTHRTVYRVETHKGVEDWAEISLNCDPWYQSPSQLHARVLPREGAFVELDQKTITDAPVNSGEDDTYSSEHIRKAPLPGLAVGSIVEEVVSTEDKHAYFAGGGVYRYPFTNSAPTERERVTVEIPASMPFAEHTENLPQLSVTRSESNGIRRIVYEQGRQPATIDGDINLPSTSTPLPILEFSTGASWAAVAREYAALSDPHILADQVRTLLPATPAATRLGTIQQLVQRLHKEVRYTGIEFDEAQLTPQSPAEVLKRHYGDCKDKATLLVAMLRAANIPAHLALLSAGEGADVNPTLPGMNRFNHAIVYVPASGGEAAMWIDATAEFNAVGTLPYDDAERLALIIAPETTGLTATPAARPEDSILTETRTFTLADLGPSRVVESSETSGFIDASYRSLYGSATTKKMKDDLEHYVQTAYLAKTLADIDHGDGADLSQPFHLKLTADGARRGMTTLSDAGVAIFPTDTFNRLPEWISTAFAPPAEDATAEQKAERARAEAQRSPTYRIRPFIYEQRYRIIVPAGFAARGLPPDRTSPLGPGSFTEHYVQDGPGVVTATLRFTTGKSLLTKQEALDFRQAVTEAGQREMIGIAFEQSGAKLLAAGKIKEALAADQAAVAQNPKSALPHVRLARALLAVGVGDMARTEAARGVALEPASAAALTTQGWVLQHDVLGVRFGPGFDREGAIQAFRKALPLQSEDFDPRFDLGILYEFDSAGVRYSPASNLGEAIGVYEQLIETEKKKNSGSVPQYRVNLAYCLLFHHDYKKVDALLQDIPAGINRSTLAITSAIAQKDVAAGIAAADHLNVSTDDRNKGLASAGNYLAQLGLYAQASELLSSGVQGGKDAPAIARQIELYRNLRRVPLASPPMNTPEATVFAYMNAMMSGGADRAKLAPFFCPNAYVNSAAFERNVAKNLESVGFLHAAAATSQMSEIVLRDVILGSMTLKATGDDITGYRVLSQSFGQSTHFFVVKENAVFHLVASDSDSSETGRLALYALEHGQAPLAKSLLDWKRELMHKGGGDDPFSGDLLPRFWTVGSTREGADSPEAMRVAAISLLAGAIDLKPLLDSLVPLRDKATGSHQSDFNLLLARGYAGAEQPAPALTYIAELLKEEPDSTSALSLAGEVYAINGDGAAWKAMLAPRLERKPAEADLLRAQARMLMSQHDYAAARAATKLVFDSGHANSSDYNSYAWLGLFDNQLGPDITAAAQQSNVVSKNGNFGDLHTMACVYAAQGKVTEAQQVLTQAMAAGNLSHPNSAVWYALGLLYEDYGLREAALAAYKRVEAHEFDDHTFINPQSTYLLAQKRIRTMSGSAEGAL
jgi:tetratricopeptide (TPR) repeat protein